MELCSYVTEGESRPRIDKCRCAGCAHTNMGICGPRTDKHGCAACAWGIEKYAPVAWLDRIDVLPVCGGTSDCERYAIKLQGDHL